MIWERSGERGGGGEGEGNHFVVSLIHEFIGWLLFVPDLGSNLQFWHIGTTLQQTELPGLMPFHTFTIGIMSEIPG